MITSLIVMLALPNFGHMITFTNDLSHVIKLFWWRNIKSFSAPFSTISSNLALLQLPNENLYLVSGGVNSPNKVWSQPFLACPQYDDFSQPICSSKSHKHNNYDKTIYKVPPLLLVLPGKPVHQTIHYPTVNFGPLSRASVPNPMLTTAFDT